MKYTIVVNQRVVADVNEKIEDKKNRLDLVDCAILEWIVQICSSRDTRICSAREDGMTWISYQKMIDDMPLLNITTKSGIYKRLAKLGDAGFIRLMTKNQRTYVDYTIKTEKLSYEYGQKSANQPFPTGNGRSKTVSSRKQNRFPQETDKNTRTRNLNFNKIHERNVEVKDDLNIPGLVRAKAMNDFIRLREKSETFVAFFERNKGKYMTA